MLHNTPHSRGRRPATQNVLPRSLHVMARNVFKPFALYVHVV
jgi:hypothetical protein